MADTEKKEKKGGSMKFLKGLLIGVLIGCLVGLLMPTAVKALRKPKNLPDTTPTEPNVVSAHYLGFTAIDFMDAILGSTRIKEELVVMEQDVEYVSLITKAGFGDWAVFRKTKSVTFAGTGVYTLDLSKLDASRITVDDEEKTVTLKIPHTTLTYLELRPEDMTFDDTEKGLLAFGDLKLTMEEQNAFERLAKQNMAKKLATQTLFTRADGFAQMKCWEIFQPLVDTVSKEYRLVTSFE